MLSHNLSERVLVPEISRFFGIVVRMFFEDHPPPHFHASYGGRGAWIGLQPLEVLASDLPARGLSMVLEWAALHQRELWQNWERLHSGRPAERIAPLA